MTSTIKFSFRPTAIAFAAAVLTHGVAVSQNSFQGQSVAPSLGNPSNVFPGTSNGAINYAINAAVARLTVSVEKNDLAADGVGGNRISIAAFDASGKPLSGDFIATVEVSGGARVLLDGAKTDEFGPGRRDADRVTPGIQITLKNGQAAFTLLSPVEPGDVRVRITAGAAVAQGVVSYVPELREFVAAGLLEGIVMRRRIANNSIVPVRIEDGFERELRRWVRNSSDGKGYFGVRSAFFVKGRLQGDSLNGWLLTAAFDSDKETRARYMRDPRAEEMYPVYGDSSIKGADAKSADRFYLRLDKGRTYGLYGDFNTGDGFSQLSGGGNVAGLKARNLGAYNRSATGLRGHFEDKNYFVNAFVFKDSLKQVVEEFRGNGTSGPFRVSSNNGIQNTEKVELVIRDRNQVNVIIEVRPLSRFEDYAFEPFSGALLMKQPVPSVDANGNPVSLRISYEVDQGGKEFTAAGIDGQVRVGEKSEVGGSYVKDQNPLSPYSLASANVMIGMGEKTTLVVEAARSKSTRYLSGGGSTTTPTGAAGELINERSGGAYRADLGYRGESFTGLASAMASSENFYNPNASLGEGRSEFALKGTYEFNPSWSVYAEATRSATRTPGPVDPARDAQALGLRYKSGSTFSLDLSLRHTEEEAGFVGGSTISGNSGLTGGGFAGLGGDALNPVTGTTILSNSGLAGGAVSAANREASTARLALGWQPSERWAFNGEIEGGTNSQRRLGLGLKYQIAERARAYANYETQRGLTSSNSLNPADKSNAFTLGVDTTYMPGGQLFSEYRLRDSLSGATASNRDMQLATGVRNTWNVREGLAYTTSAEVLKVFQGSVRNAYALAGGVDYTVSELSKFSAKLEMRKLADDVAAVGDQSQTQWLSTLSYARKIDRDWTLLARNYLLYVQNKDNAAGAGIGNAMQDRFQVGFAWRPVDNNRVSGLGRYEYKTVKDRSTVTGEDYGVHVMSMHGTYHPSRPWWFNGKVAYKDKTEKLFNPNNTSLNDYFRAIQVAGRITYDLSENWDVGVMASVLQGLKGDKGRQHAFGLEVGYLLKTDLWLSAGVNFTGFSDKDLTSGEYTNRGLYLRLRYKFDENLWRSDNKTVNRALDR
jgi:hypothetical protein